MQSCCKNCHFLAKDFLDGAKRATLSLRKWERESLPIENWHSVQCAHGVWSVNNNRRLTLIVKQDVITNGVREIMGQPRGDTCFFWPVQEGMSLDAASTLQKRANENKELKKSHLLTQIGLGFAAVGLLLSALFGLLGLLME